jgi:ABC-type multidrug transport system fused ATPase/permease subunit
MSLSEKELENEATTKPLSMKLIARLFGTLGPYIWLLFLGNFFCIICAATDMAIIREVKKIIDHPDLDSVSILHVLFPLICYCVLNRITGWTQWLLTCFSTNKGVENLRKKLFSQLQCLSKNFYDTHKTGWLISRNTGDIFLINHFMLFSLMMLIYFGTAILFAFYEMTKVSPVLLVPTLFIVPVVCLVTVWYKKRMEKAQRETRKQNSKMVANLSENVRGIRVVQAFSREKYNLNQFNILNQRNRDLEIRVSRLNALFLPSIDFLGILNTSIVITFAMILLSGSIPFLPKFTLTTGELVAYISYMNIVVWPIRMLLEIYSIGIAAMAAAERIFEIIDLTPSVVDPYPPKKIEILHGNIFFDKVSFSYTENSPLIFRNLTYEILPGQTVALVGESGVGKTTFASLIARFYDVNDGAILIDGKNIKNYTQESVHRSMGIVLQSGYLFSGSVLDNIQFRLSDLSRAKIIQIAKKYGTHEAIINLPDGYDTQVLEGGRLISLGQRQIISLTRALASDPRILIMDEPTSSLDVYTEYIIQEAMKKIVGNRTTVIIAHRLSTVKHSDVILVVGNQGIREAGTHNELMKNNFVYSSLVAKYDKQMHL